MGVILWDLNRLDIDRRLPKHPAPISCVAVDPVTGEVVTCCGQCLYVWTVNGSLAAEKLVGESTSDLITAVCISDGPDWADNKVIVTGHKDGSLRFWGMALVGETEIRREDGDVSLSGSDALPVISQISSAGETTSDVSLSDESGGIDRVPYMCLYPVHRFTAHR